MENAKTNPDLEAPTEAEKPEDIDILQKAEALSKRIEAANRKSEELLLKHEQIQTRAVLGGRTFAGVPPKVNSPEQIKRDRVNKMLETTGLKI